MVATEELMEVFVDIADTLVDDFDLVDFLHGLARYAAAVGGATSAGLVLAGEDGRLQFMAASSEDAQSVELFQLQSAEGPCLDCYRSGTPVFVTDLSGELMRWPAFAPVALDRGVRSVHAFPMRLRTEVIGTLSVFGGEPRRLEPEEVQVIQAFADVATIGILQQRAISAAETLTVQLQGALSSRIAIEQAKGVIAQMLDISLEVAFDRMRSQARSAGVALTILAGDVVERRADPRSWRR